MLALRPLVAEYEMAEVVAACIGLAARTIADETGIGAKKCLEHVSSTALIMAEGEARSGALQRSWSAS